MDNQHLTKKEKHLLKKQRKEQERLLKARRKNIRKIAGIYLPVILITGLVIWGLVSYFSKEHQESYSGAPKIEINPKEYDAGTVSMASGLVKKTYEIKNTGEGDLKIERIWTSCMCTTATLKVRDKISPEFGMHDSPLFWSEKIVPGQTGFLEVTFDPAFHGPQGIGPVMRAVYLSTNDPQNKKAEIRLMANVTP